MNGLAVKSDLTGVEQWSKTFADLQSILIVYRGVSVPSNFIAGFSAILLVVQPSDGSGAPRLGVNKSLASSGVTLTKVDVSWLCN